LNTRAGLQRLRQLQCRANASSCPIGRHGENLKMRLDGRRAGGCAGRVRRRGGARGGARRAAGGCRASTGPCGPGSRRGGATENDKDVHTASKPPDLPRWWLPTHDAAFRARAHARCADTQRGHACTLASCAVAPRALAPCAQSTIVLLATMLLCCWRCAELPCARKRCVCLRAVFGFDVLVQALAHVQLPCRPACSRPAPRPQPPRCCCAACYACAVRNCPVHASAARACALRLCALCLCRYSHTCSSSSRCVLRSPTSSTSRGACIHRVVLVDVATHIPCRPRRHGSTKCDAYACDAHAHCGDWQNEMRCTCMLVACTQDMHLRVCTWLL
jgi:hypothetical protein